ncbi:MAG: P-II family nitrogen regulator [Eubacteriales bacterium]
MGRQTEPREKRVKLLVGIVQKEDEAAFARACNEQCLSLHFSVIGHGTARSHVRSFFGMDEVERRVVFGLFPDYAERRLLKTINDHLRLYLMGRGIAFTIPLSGVSNLISYALLSAPDKDAAKNPYRKEKRRVMYELIVAVVNQKFTERVLDATRAVGAAGATVVHSIGVSNEQAERVLGTALKQDTDTVAILTSTAFKGPIMDAIIETAGLKTEGRAVVFSLPVDHLVGLRPSDEEDPAQK